MAFTTPVLLLLFNRPSLGRQLIGALRQVAPSIIYISIDGPRPGNVSDIAGSEACQRLEDEIDWECEIVRRYRDKNLGCRDGVIDGISWFFQHEEAGIILEDDCIPDASFFQYSEECLERYCSDERVMMISGCNFVDCEPDYPHSYVFSRFVHIWGWATWRRAWNLYDSEMRAWKEGGWRKQFQLSFGEGLSEYLSQGFDTVINEGIDTWDYQWSFTCLSNSGLCVVPKTNLISNIGFGADATHTVGESMWSERETGKVEFPLQHPDRVWPDLEFEERLKREKFGIQSVERKSGGKSSSLVVRLLKRLRDRLTRFRN